MPCPPGCVPDLPFSQVLAQVFSQAVTWGLVIAGWCVVSRDHNRRERRKEIRGQIDRLSEVTFSIRDSALRYLSTEGGSDEGQGLEVRLKADLQRLGLAVTRLKKRENINVGDKQVELWRVITGGDFESATRSAKTQNSARGVEIAAAANALVDSLEDQFRDSFL